MTDTTCCFVGHREISETEEIRKQLYFIVDQLIRESSVDTFLFGSKSKFNSLCYEVVTRLKEKYPYIRRVYVRAEFPQIKEDYEKYLLESYEDTYYPTEIIGAGKAVYIKRNRVMIDKSRFCILYYKENYVRVNRKSGTKMTLDYAIKKKRKITILPCPMMLANGEQFKIKQQPLCHTTEKK